MNKFPFLAGSVHTNLGRCGQFYYELNTCNTYNVYSAVSDTEIITIV